MHVDRRIDSFQILTKQLLPCIFSEFPTVSILQARSMLSHPDSRSDPNVGSEPSSGLKTIYWDSLLALSDMGMSKSYNCINISYTKITK